MRSTTAAAALDPPVLKASVVVLTDNGLFISADLNACHEGEESRNIEIPDNRKKKATSKNNMVSNIIMSSTRFDPKSNNIPKIIN